MGKTCCWAAGLGLAGALIGLHIYMCMPDGEKRHLRRGLSDIVDDQVNSSFDLSQIKGY